MAVLNGLTKTVARPYGYPDAPTLSASGRCVGCTGIRDEVAGMVQLYRMFDGKRYNWAGYARTKAEADRRKAKLKGEGFKVRIVKMLGTSIRAPPERGKHPEKVWFLYKRDNLADPRKTPRTW